MTKPGTAVPTVGATSGFRLELANSEDQFEEFQIDAASFDTRRFTLPAMSVTSVYQAE